ncbi:MAG: biotin carboxylase [Ruminococcaceae bacterium]|nr:biotin carboxylase [Oscillospiraceae bacterium]
MAEEIKIPRRILGLILSSVSAGVVPRVGASYIAIGRTEEIASLVKDLDFVKDDGGCMRFIIGKYGSGKSFLLTLLRGYAMEHGFVCADADLSPERKLCGTNGAGIATYRELIRNLSVKSSPEGGALGQIISKWLSSISMELAAEGLDPESPVFEKAVRNEVFSFCRELENHVGGFDFALVLSNYYSATVNGDENKKSACMRWFRGEFTTKTQAKMMLNVSDIIDDENWYDYIKLWCAFFKKIGYSGFCVFIDECVNLYKISNRISREKNYEKLLSMFNDSLGGRAPGLAIFMGGTPQFLEDTRRGVYSYEALRSRLNDRGYAVKTELKNFMGPIIRLRRMSDNELLALVKRITILHSQYYKEEARITSEEMIRFVKICSDRAGADTLITPREIIREYISLLDVMLQNPETSFKDVVGESGEKVNLASSEADNGDVEFEDFDDI